MSGPTRTKARSCRRGRTSIECRSTFNTVGSMTAKAYKTQSDDALLSWRQTFNAFGQATAVTGNCSLGQRVQAFTYDNAARLVGSKDTCSSVATTRDYDFDVTSNRTKLVEKQGSATTTWSNTFDSASRQLSTTATGSGAGSGTYSYDVFGRTTILPGIDAVRPRQRRCRITQMGPRIGKTKARTLKRSPGTRWGGYPPRTSQPMVERARTRSPATTPEHLIRQPGPKINSPGRGRATSPVQVGHWRFWRPGQEPPRRKLTCNWRTHTVMWSLRSM